MFTTTPAQPSATSQYDYVHGYSAREHERLCDQAATLTELLHHDTVYPAGSAVLEAGCGVGAQTVILAKRSPNAHFTAIDCALDSLAQARTIVTRERLTNVTVQHADIFHLPFAPEHFDHIFVCFVLEHLRYPQDALLHLKQVLKPGGTLTVIEGDHDSAYFHPDSPDARHTIRCLIESQARMGGNACIGRQLFPLLREVGFQKVLVSPRMVYVDASRPAWVEGFTKNTFTAMVAGVREQALTWGLSDPVRWDRGIADLYRTTQPDGTFCYTFFKGVAVR